MRVGAVVLAAGASTRLGRPKQLATLAGVRLLERSVRVATAAGCAPVVVVLGAAAEEIARACDLGAALVVRNDDWAEGMASSIRVGIGALVELEGAIVMTCDQPAVTAEHLRALMGASRVASSYAGRRGVPAFFPASDFAALRMLRGDAGARSLLADAPAIELAGGELDVDTAEALELARSLYPE